MKPRTMFRKNHDCERQVEGPEEREEFLAARTVLDFLPVLVVHETPHRVRKWEPVQFTHRMPFHVP